MPFPESERTLYRENTLAEVICQLRFPPILAVASELPADFQEAIRADYPGYSVDEAVAGLPPEMSALIARNAQQTHRFRSEDGHASVALATNFLSVSTRAYVRWEDFLSSVDQARNALESIYRPAFYERVGLRYQNVIDRQTLGLSARNWSDLLKAPVLGPLGDAEVAPIVIEWGARALFDIASASEGRVHLQWGLVVPSAPTTSQAYLLDADYYTERRTQSDAIPPVLNEFHTASGRVFRWAIAQPLHDALGPRPAD
jgi:uncharacterized protein (TIGR04255 family)